jgi:hypothetical protein
MSGRSLCRNFAHHWPTHREIVTLSLMAGGRFSHFFLKIYILTGPNPKNVKISYFWGRILRFFSSSGCAPKSVVYGSFVRQNTNNSEKGGLI